MKFVNNVHCLATPAQEQSRTVHLAQMGSTFMSLTAFLCVLETSLDSKARARNVMEIAQHAGITLQPALHVLHLSNFITKAAIPAVFLVFMRIPESACSAIRNAPPVHL